MTAIAGTRVVLADDQVWTLATNVPNWSERWDRLADDNVYSGKYNPYDIWASAAELLLAANPDLAIEIAVDLVRGVDAQSLVSAVELALFGPLKPYHSYSEWINCTLLANGLDPDKVPPQYLRGVLTILEERGRTMPQNKFISSLERQAKRAKRRALADGTA